MGGATSIVLGVTGHRSFDDDGSLVDRVDGAVDSLAGGRAVHLLTSLAEGADRLVAERVLARPGGSIEALLPLEAADYEPDFADAASVAAFRRLLATATAVEVVPDAVLDGAPPTPAPSPRERRYLAAGLAVVERSEGLVALWDGRAARGHGGTAEVVEHARRLGRPVRVVEVDR